MDAVPPGAVLLRALTREDVPALARIAADEGRNVATEEYERFLRLEGARGFVLLREGRLIGAATALRYFEHAFLGPVLLEAGPDPTGHTIALLAHLIESLQREGVHVVETEASAREEELLSRMGFVALRGTLVLERAEHPPDAAGEAQARSDPMEARHLLDVGSLDADAVGFGRKDYLLALRNDRPEGARVLERDGDVVGYSLLRRTARGYHLGPIVTRDDDPAAAHALARDAAAAAGSAPVTVLLPSQSALVALLEAEGFARVASLTRMRAAARPSPMEHATAHEWALGGRMTG